MNIIEINRISFKLIQTGLNVLSAIKYNLFDCRKYKKYIKKNDQLRESASVQTCYVLGNGPSLKHVDLNVLQGKDVITVNKSIKTSVFSMLKPKYHVVLDRFILADIADDVEEELRREDSNTIVILHRSAVERFSKYPRARFAYGTKMASSPRAFKNDMTGNMTTFLNVLPFAVSCAMYIGYKEIVLLGNDFSFFTARKDQHFYDIESNITRTESLYSDLSGCAIVLTEYRTLYNYAKSHGITIVNATEGSLLDEIPQGNLIDYL